VRSDKGGRLFLKSGELGWDGWMEGEVRLSLVSRSVVG